MNDNVSQLVRDAIQKYRSKLLDLTGHNPLLNFRHSDRSRSHVRVVDEIPEALFRKLCDGSRLTFRAIPEPESDAEDESRPEFLEELRTARSADDRYAKARALLGPNPSQRQLKAIERELRDRIRRALGWPPLDPLRDVRRRASELNIRADFELEDDPGQHVDALNTSKVQTLLFEDALEKKLGAIQDSARLLRQDAGLNALYCAFGFLEYYESPASSERRAAPLVFLPVELDRVVERGEYRYFLTPRSGEEVETNVVLAELLRRQFSLDLPEWPESDTTALASYLDEVRRLVSNQPDWTVRRYVTVGLFTFSTLVMYHDLDPVRWESSTPLQDSYLLRALIAGDERAGPGLSYAEDYDLDRAERREVLLIADADSSQESAVIDVLEGRNSVIQGPPGTGKSQTITNTIAAAMNEGKSVLFVAEKMAALEVVRNRLADAGLEHFCLEIHSNKTSRTTVTSALARRLEFRPEQLAEQRFDNNVEALRRAREELVYYAGRAGEFAGRTRLRVQAILLGSAIREHIGSVVTKSVLTARFASPLELTPQMMDQMKASASTLEEHVRALGQSGSRDHPWRGVRNCDLTDLDLPQLESALSSWRDSLEKVGIQSRAIGEQFTSTDRPTLAAFKSAWEGFLTAPAPPEHCVADILRLAQDPGRRSGLKALVAAVQNLISRETSLRSVLPRIELTRPACDSLREHINVLSELGSGAYGEVRNRAAERRRQLTEFSERLATLERGIATCAAPATVESALALLEGVERLGELPRNCWAFRLPGVLDEANGSMLQAAATRCASLKNNNERLEGFFDLSVLASFREGPEAATALRTANPLARLISGRCRKLKRVYKAAQRSVWQRFPIHDDIADDILECFEHLRLISEYLSDQRIREACGASWRGLDTPFDRLLRVGLWARSLDAALAEYTTAGGRVRHVLTVAVPETLARLQATLGAESGAMRAAILSVSDGPQSDLADVAARSLSEGQRVAAAVASLDAIGVPVQAELRTLSDLATPLEQLVDRRDALASDLSGDTNLNLTLADLVGRHGEISETLDYATLLASIDIPDRARAFIFEHPSRLEEIRSLISSALSLVEDSENAFARYSNIANLDEKSWCGRGSVLDADLDELVGRCAVALDNRSSLGDYLSFLLAEDAAREIGLGPLLQAFEDDECEYSDLVPATELVFFRSAAEALLADNRLRRHVGSTHEELKSHFARLDREYLSLCRQRLAATLQNRPIPQGTSVGRVADLTELGLVRHVAGQTRPRTTVRELLRRSGEAIKELMPCWLMSPMSVAQFLSPGTHQFDIVVMDEASQIRPEEALGAIARARQLVVVGDQMQLPPTSFFQRLSSNDVGEDDEDDVEVQQESILELSASRFHPLRRLKWHYRSEHSSLINFSNRQFYDGQLMVFPSAYDEHPDYGVSVEQVDGVYSSGVNPDEVEAVIDAASALMTRFPDRSLGIVAVNSKQTELLREAIDDLCATDPVAEAYRRSWQSGLESLFVKNLESVQGDERDVVFVSTVYGRDRDGNFFQRYGPINSINGHRRLNVLFTRAKKKVVVFTSMRPEDIHDRGRHWGVRALKSYLEYGRNGIIPDEGVSLGGFESEFEEWVAGVLKAQGYEAVPQFGVAGYRLDLAVRHPRNHGRFLCGIECDGAAYHSAKSARDRDRLRDEVLKKLGWDIYRIWSTDWFRNPATQTKRMIDHIDRLASG